MKRKFMVLFLAIVLCFAFVGCGNDEQQNVQGNDGEYPVMKLTMAAQGKETGDINISSRMFMDKITEYSGGNITFDEYWNAQLGTGPDQLKNIGSQVADIGDVVTLYTPADLTLSQIAFCVPFMSTDPGFVAELQNKFAEKHTEVTTEWENAGCHLLFYKGIGTYNVVGKLNIAGETAKVADMKNMKIEMGGVYYPHWFSAIDATPMSAPSSSSAYQDIKSNVANTTFLNSAGICDQKLFEVSDMMIDAGLGARACHAFVINQDTWNSFDDNTKALFEKVAEEVLTEYTEWAVNAATDSNAMLEEEGIKIYSMTADEQSQWCEAILENDNTIQQWIDEANAAGYDGAQYMSDYLSMAEEMGYKFPFDTSVYKK